MWILGIQRRSSGQQVLPLQQPYGLGVIMSVSLGMITLLLLSYLCCSCCNKIKHKLNKKNPRSWFPPPPPLPSDPQCLVGIKQSINTWNINQWWLKKCVLYGSQSPIDRETQRKGNDFEHSLVCAGSSYCRVTQFVYAQTRACEESCGEGLRVSYRLGYPVVFTGWPQLVLQQKPAFFSLTFPGPGPLTPALARDVLGPIWQFSKSAGATPGFWRPQRKWGDISQQWVSLLWSHSPSPPPPCTAGHPLSSPAQTLSAGLGKYRLRMKSVTDVGNFARGR